MTHVISRMKAMAAGLLLLAPAVAAPQAGTYPDDATVYARCIIDRQVADPKNIPFADSSACLTSMGIPDPGEEARKEARERWHDCLIYRVVRFDDGVSTLSDVAEAIVPMCESEWAAWIEALWAIPSIKSAMAKGVKVHGRGAAMQIILLNRKPQTETKPRKN